MVLSSLTVFAAHSVQYIMAPGNRTTTDNLHVGVVSTKQRQVGEILGFNGAATEVRMAQYEAEAREPKAALVEQMASIFNVSPKAISVPEIDTYDGLMHTFFALEDMYGLKIAEIDGELCLHLDRTLNPDMNLLDLFELWHRQSMRLATA